MTASGAIAHLILSPNELQGVMWGPLWSKTGGRGVGRQGGCILDVQSSLMHKDSVWGHHAPRFHLERGVWDCPGSVVVENGGRSGGKALGVGEGVFWGYKAVWCAKMASGAITHLISTWNEVCGIIQGPLWSKTEGGAGERRWEQRRGYFGGTKRSGVQRWCLGPSRISFPPGTRCVGSCKAHCVRKRRAEQGKGIGSRGEGILGVQSGLVCRDGVWGHHASRFHLERGTWDRPRSTVVENRGQSGGKALGAGERVFWGYKAVRCAKTVSGTITHFIPTWNEVQGVVWGPPWSKTEGEGGERCWEQGRAFFGVQSSLMCEDGVWSHQAPRPHPERGVWGHPGYIVVENRGGRGEEVLGAGEGTFWGCRAIRCAKTATGAIMYLVLCPNEVRGVVQGLLWSNRKGELAGMRKKREISKKEKRTFPKRAGMSCRQLGSSFFRPAGLAGSFWLVN